MSDPGSVTCRTGSPATGQNHTVDYLSYCEVPNPLRVTGGLLPAQAGRQQMAFVRVGRSASFAGLIWVFRHCAAATGNLCNRHGLGERRCKILSWKLRI